MATRRCTPKHRFAIYFNRLRLPEVPPALRPPPMDVSGLRRLWSWLGPVLTVPDKRLLESAGLDALVGAGEVHRRLGAGGLGCIAPKDGATMCILADAHPFVTCCPDAAARLQMAQRVIGFGNLMFAPLTILGVGV